MNKKALALVLALIISIPFTLVPMSGAFADSDIGISNSLLLSCFAWYTGTPGVDSSGIWYGSSFEDYSDSVESGVAGTTSFGVQCLLNTTGDYVDYQLNEYPFYANSWNSPILIVQLLLDRSSYGGPVEDLAYEFYTDSNDVIYEPFYQYVVPRFTLNNTDYVVMNLFFNIGVSVNSGHPHIKIMYDGTPANFIAMGMRFMGYRYSPEATLTTAELYQIQTDLITSFNMARLLDIIGSDDSDIDLTTIENALASMDAKLTTIINNTDSIESLINTVNESIGDNTDALELFYSYFFGQFDHNLYNAANVTFHDDNNNTIETSPFRSTSYYIIDNEYISKDRYFISYYFSTFHSDVPIKIEYAFSLYNDTSGFSWHEAPYFVLTSGGMDYYYFYIIAPEYMLGHNTTTTYPHVILHISCDTQRVFYTNSFRNLIYTKPYTSSWFDRIIYYFRVLTGELSFGSNSVSDDITSTAAELDQEAQSVESFESTYQTQLQSAHDDVDLTEYPINATNGMTYLQTYTNRAFVASNGFRVFIIYPIIFVLIGIFLRRFV